ncbi:MAG: FHA domain-containing protein [Fuerstiella sp.]|nr:FHA domain-containing protein [Fuerstiella sp.]
MIESELHVLGGKHAGQVIPLNGRKFLIGRESDCQLRPNSELVSRHHCVFAIDEYSVRLRDLGSTNGTTVNGERIVKETTLVAGDRVVVGNLEFEFRVLNPASASGDETVVSNAETVMEFTTPSEDSTSDHATEQNEPIDGPPLSVPQDLTTPIDQPQPVTSPTTVIPQQGMVPGQTPYQPMSYPGQVYGGYPYQQQPMQQQPMPQQPMPQQPMPQQPMPQQPMPVYPPLGYPPQPQPMMPGFQQQSSPLIPDQQIPPANEPSLDVNLPDPSETGATNEPPKAAASAQSAQSGNANDGDSTGAAADIIRQHTQRRPG